ncbi:SurA N-terminal domain-containing protein [Marinilongibacter aquaticus]|uniref:peptidylprolyl isomerase n=1 Tax=Marinilongibacter aquaticus TaxID=2975157 RepID=UPI0021BDD1AD|nr:peptidylprolyl isomerase [Marinilongibacter aquaticus]UBM57845.1 SurA N-terminal domain-containing protein [Marinilongibacter aquaticus]
MALINKIREKSGVAVGFLAIALLLFIVGGDIFSGNSMAGGLFNGDKNKVGTINGVDIDYQQFNKLVDVQRQQMEMSSGRSVSDAELKTLRDQVWEQLIQEDAFQPEYDKLGIDVTADELREMIQGTKNLHPFIKQQFTDPSTGVFNEAQHRQFINAAANKQLPAEQMVIWENFKSNLIQVRKAEKYQNLIAAADYITSAEAKREYKAQTAKASADFLFVPFYSLSDSLAKVSDSDVESYYSKHKDEFTPYDSRSFDYVVFNVLPSKEDSVGLQQELTDLARGLAGASDAQAYASSNSDVNHPYLWSPGELSEETKALIDNSIVGATVGPVKEGQDYTIYKYEGTERDSLYTVRASHILIRPAGTDDAAKADAKQRAQDLLNQIKNGADFAAMARINGSDGTAQVGGDLGYFNNDGRMVPEFEKAVFAFNGSGLMPNLVETDFGYHIIKVTEAKTNLKYKLAAITKELQPSEFTLNEMYQKAEDLRASISSVEDLEKKVEGDDELVLLKAQRVSPAATGFNTVQNAREVVLWAFGDEAEEGKVADHVFVIDESYIIAALTGSTDKEDPKASDFKAQIEAKVKSEKKGELILDKLASANGDLESVAKSYGAGALVESVEDITFQTGMLSSAGIDGTAIGKLFAMKSGETSKPFIGQNGVFILKKTNEVDAPEIADYAQYKASIEQRKGPYAGTAAADQAVREAADIVDRRAKMF